MDTHGKFGDHERSTITEDPIPISWLKTCLAWSVEGQLNENASSGF